jgi:hypothetical protein
MALGSGTMANTIVSIFGKIFAQHWGPRIDDILRSALLTLMGHANPMLTMVPPLLTDRQLRGELTADLHDPAGLGGFWTWYDSLPEGIRAQANGPVLARLRKMLTCRFVRRVVGSPPQCHVEERDRGVRGFSTVLCIDVDLYMHKITPMPCVYR